MSLLSIKLGQLTFCIFFGLLIIASKYGGCHGRYLPTRNYGDNLEKLRELMYQILESSNENQQQQPGLMAVASTTSRGGSVSNGGGVGGNLQWPTKSNYGSTDGSTGTADFTTNSRATRNGALNSSYDANNRLRYLLKHPQLFMNQIDQLI